MRVVKLTRMEHQLEHQRSDFMMSPVYVRTHTQWPQNSVAIKHMCLKASSPLERFQATQRKL